MRLIPLHCPVCCQFSLVDQLSISPEGMSQCDCGGLGRALPSGTFGPEDRGLFESIASALSSAPIDWMNATRLLIELEASGGPISKLSALKQRVPSLAIITVIVGASPTVARKASAMFETLLEAISRTRSRSDASSLLPPVDAKPQGTGLRRRRAGAAR